MDTKLLYLRSAIKIKRCNFLNGPGSKFSKIGRGDHHYCFNAFYDSGGTNVRKRDPRYYNLLTTKEKKCACFETWNKYKLHFLQLSLMKQNI